MRVAWSLVRLSEAQRVRTLSSADRVGLETGEGVGRPDGLDAASVPNRRPCRAVAAEGALGDELARADLVRQEGAEDTGVGAANRTKTPELVMEMIWLLGSRQARQ